MDVNPDPLCLIYIGVDIDDYINDVDQIFKVSAQVWVKGAVQGPVQYMYL